MREMYEKLNCPSKDAKLLLAVFQQPAKTELLQSIIDMESTIYSSRKLAKLIGFDLNVTACAVNSASVVTDDEDK